MRATLTLEEPVVIDPDWLRKHFLRHGVPRPRVAGDLDSRPGDDSLKPASVLVPIVVHAQALTVLFTRRTAHLRSHSGQVSFPGGRAETGDPTPEATALRETHEEIGLDGAMIEVIGRLGDYCTRTGYCVSPVVALVTPPLQLRLDRHEVEAVFEVPLSFLLDPAHHERHAREFQGRQVHYTAMPYGEHYIWGATAGILVNLYHYLRDGA